MAQEYNGSSNVVIIIISMPYTEKRVGLSAPHIIIIEQLASDSSVPKLLSKKWE